MSGQQGIGVPISLTVNGSAVSRTAEPRLLLSDFLRHDLGLTGTHVGCETSLCGSCTVLVDGKAVKSCTMFAVQADGSAVTTVEGLAKDGQLHPVQQGFWECHGLQCGFCTPGMMMASVALLAQTAKPSREQITEGLRGNLCRCTGYSHIIDAVNHAAAHGGVRLQLDSAQGVARG